MAFKIKDGIRIGTVDVFNNAGTLLVNAPTATKVNNQLSAGAGLTGGPYDGSGAVTIAHSNSVTAGTASEGGSTRTLAFGETFNVPSVTYDAQGHVTAKGNITLTLPAAPAAANNGTLTLGIGTAGGTNTTVTIGTGTGFSANTATNTTYDIKVGPALTNLATLMATAGAGFIKRGATADTYTIDTNTYLTAEADTLQTVTGRGATSNVATISLTATTASTTTGTGTLVVSGGVGIAGNANIGGNVVITGNLTVDGTTTTVNSTTITVDDKNIELGSVATPTNTTADGGGITLKGATDKTFNWLNATAAWTSSEHLALAAGKNILMNGATSGTITLTATATAGTNTITFPAATGTVALTSQIPTVNNGTLGASAGTTGATNTTVALNFSAAYSANSASNVTINPVVGPALTGLASIMTGATTGFLKKTAADTYTLDTNTYLTSQSTDFKTVTVTDTDSGYTWADNGSAVAEATGDTLTIVSGNGVEVDVDATNDALRIRSQGSENAYSQAMTVSVATPVAGTAYNVDSWAKATYRSAKYVITATQGTFYQSCEIMVFNDGTTAGQFTEYAVFSTAPASELTFTIDASGTDMILKASTPTATTALTFKIHRIINLV